MKRLFLTLLLLTLSLYGQKGRFTIQGRVLDEEGNHLAFANVYLEGRMEGSMTDSNGYFSFHIFQPGQYTLICSYIGYETYRTALLVDTDNIPPLTIVMREQPVESETVLVTASRFSSGDEKGVTLTPLEVVSTPGAAADVFWAIKTFPGVQQVDEGAGLFVRGGDVSETAVILDGAYLFHPYRYESPNGGYFGTIGPFLLKGTYFSSGGFSAEYGNALSGALIMESLDIPVQRKTTLGIGLAAYSTMINLPIIPEKMGISASGNYSQTRTMFELNGHRRQFSKFPQALDANLNWIYRYSPRGSLKLFLFREEDKVGIEIKRPDEGGFYLGDSKNSLANLRWKHLISPKFLLTGNLAVTRFESSQNLVAFHLNSNEQLWQARLTGEWKIGNKISLHSGMELFCHIIELDGQVTQEYLDLNPEAPVTHIDLDYLSNRVTAFDKIIWEEAGHLKMEAGLRYERDSQSGQQVVDPRFSITGQLKNQWNIVLSVGQYHQFPKPLYYDENYGNPALRAMKSWHYIAGIARQTESSIIRAELYYKDYRDLILEDDQLNFTNHGYGYAKGLDVFAKQNLGFLKGWISYSYLEARRKWQDAPHLTSPVFDITHTLTWVMELDFSFNWHLGIAQRFATGKPYTSAPDRYHDQRVPAYRKLDINLTYLRRFWPGNLTVFYLAVSNALGRENVFDYLYSRDYQKREVVTSIMLRSVYTGVSFTF